MHDPRHGNPFEAHFEARGRHGNPFEGGRGRFPFGGFFAQQFRAGGPRVRKGDVRASILALLAEGPHNGYQVIQKIAERSDGLWRPSSGSVYPALQLLEDEGLIRTEEVEGRKVFNLTDGGRAYVADHREELTAPWDVVKNSVDDGRGPGLHHLFGELMGAVQQVSRVGSPAEIAEARRVLIEARRSLYRILAEAGNDDDE